MSFCDQDRWGKYYMHALMLMEYICRFSHLEMENCGRTDKTIDWKFPEIPDTLDTMSNFHERCQTKKAYGETDIDKCAHRHIHGSIL